MPNLINTQDMVGAYVGSNQVLALYMGTTHVWGEELGSQAIEIDCFDNMEAFEGATCSSVTISVVERFCDDIYCFDYHDGDTIGTFTIECEDNDYERMDHIWYMASSSVTSAITSAEMYLDDDHGWMLSIVSPVINGQCEMMGYKFIAKAVVDGLGLAKVDLQNENGDYEVCSNGYMRAEWWDASFAKKLTITNIPNISSGTLTGDYDRYAVNISDGEMFDFEHAKYYDMEQSRMVDEVSFYDHDNPNVSYIYDQSAGTLVVYADWNDYEYGYDDMSGEDKWLGDYRVTMSYQHTDADIDYLGKQPFRFTTGASITRQFAACPEQCDGILMIDFSNIPNDGDDHVVEIIEPNLGIVIGSLSANVTNETYAVIDCPDDPDELYYTETISDNFSEGYVRWDFEGPFNGTYMIYVDGSPLLNAAPVFNGTFKIVYVDTNSDSMHDYTSWDAYWCEVDGQGTWDDVNQECTYPE